ncbi:D-glycero-alpha-D-manno-heptose-1,7-bisphosphate 7-phosphatase [Terriglobus sp. RCC_193]|uniref:D-glycero-alpha-D-manno-heptose-1,7-bisphosphate 7-phosphatase n=1 Tax=Terriglobus sp. RCC_193 TaxID=3239218 RepID=UPI00352644EB
MKNLRPALFLDRDGVINEEVHYLWKPEDCHIVPGIIPLLQTAHALGFATIVITNQAGIGRGMYTEADFHVLMEHIRAELAPHDACLDAIYFSPFHPEHGVGQYKLDTDCRKPAPGMILRAAEEHGLDISRSVLVGDRCTDIAAGTAAGIPHLFLFGNTEATPCAGSYRKIDSLAEVEATMQTLSA